MATAWKVALQLCASEACHENQVEESRSSAELCKKIPVPSLFGGAGRTTIFGRVLWCAAMLGGGPVLDLYGGWGDSLQLLGHALQGQATRLLSFERDAQKLPVLITRLQAHADVHLLDSSNFKIPKVERSELQCFVVAGSTQELFMGRTLLDLVSESIQEEGSELGLIVLDPDVEMPPQDFAEDWRWLERKNPRMVAVYNTNLPGGAGWVVHRLLALGTYVEVFAGSNDGGQESDALRRLRAWSLLLRADSPAPKWSEGNLTSGKHEHEEVVPPTVRMAGTDAKEWVEGHLKQGWQWQNTTHRAVKGGEVLRVHRAIGGIVPIEVQKPTEDMLTPPSADTNPHRCFAEADPLATKLRVPCFLSCEGPGFDPRWGEFRRKVLESAMAGYPPSEELLLQAMAMNKGIIESDELLIRGRSRFVARLRHEYTHDGHLEGFCLFGMSAAAFVKGMHMLRMAPEYFEDRGKRYFPPQLGLGEMDTAYTLLTDSDSKGGIEFSFLETSGWAVSLEDIVTNLETQKAQLGEPFRRHEKQWPLLQQQALGGDGAPVARRLPPQLRICGIGDHLTATLDAVLMAEQALGPVSTSREFLGRYCPGHAGQGHQCRQRCELLKSCEEEDHDPVAQWLDGVIHPRSLEELPFDLDERRQRLAQVMEDPRLQAADLLVCSHPTLLCLLLAEVTTKPLFVHASSTLLYGLRCRDCSPSSNLRYLDDELAQRYLQVVHQLMKANHLAFLAEGRFLAEQINEQVGVRVPWVPPLALYIDEGSWAGKRTGRLLVLRSRFFVSLMGELLRSLLREVIALNYEQHPLEVIFLGKDKQFEEQWLSLQQLAGFDAAILWPNDLHQRTFHEVYRMAMPLLMPDADGLFRAQKMSNWGYASYGGRLAGLATDGRHPFPPWWNSWNSTPEIVSYWERFADWQMPHVQRFSSLPGLVLMASTLDLEKISKEMAAFHRSLCKDALAVVSHLLPM